MRKKVLGLFLLFIFVTSFIGLAFSLVNTVDYGKIPEYGVSNPDSIIYLAAQSQYNNISEENCLPAVSLVDNFDGTSSLVSSWWDIDGNKIYERKLDPDIKRSGSNSMKIYFNRTDSNLNWSFFAFQPMIN